MHKFCCRAHVLLIDYFGNKFLGQWIDERPQRKQKESDYIMTPSQRLPYWCFWETGVTPNTKWKQCHFFSLVGIDIETNEHKIEFILILPPQRKITYRFSQRSENSLGWTGSFQNACCSKNTQTAKDLAQTGFGSAGHCTTIRSNSNWKDSHKQNYKVFMLVSECISSM